MTHSVPGQALCIILLGALSMTAIRADEVVPLADGSTASVLRLADGGVSVAVVPALGGKLISLIGPDGREWLDRSERPYAPREPGMEYGKAEFDGGDEVLPNLGKEGDLLDHGEVWCRPWTVIDGPGITLVVDGQISPFRLVRTVTIAEGAVHLAYLLENRSDQPWSWMAAFHPLFDLEGDLQVVLPGEQRLRIGPSKGGFLGKGGEETTWAQLIAGPLGSDWIPADGGRYWKAVALQVQQPVRLRRRDGSTLAMRWQGAGFEHCAFWCSEGAVGGLKHLAAEPTNSPEDALSDAEKSGEAEVLPGGGSVTWTIDLSWE